MRFFLFVALDLYFVYFGLFPLLRRVVLRILRLVLLIPLYAALVLITIGLRVIYVTNVIRWLRLDYFVRFTHAQIPSLGLRDILAWLRPLSLNSRTLVTFLMK